MKFSNFPRKCYSILLRFLTTQKCSIVTIATTGCCHQPISCCCQSNEQHIVNQAENHFHHFFASHSSQNSIQSTLSICKFQAKKSAVLLSKRFLLLTSFLLHIYMYCHSTFGFENQLIEIISKPYYLLLRFHVSRETCEAIHSPKETLQNLKSSYSASNAEDTIASSSPFSPSVWLLLFGNCID